MIVHLLPEQSSCSRIVSIIKGSDITFSNPVVNTVLCCLQIHGADVLHFFIMRCCMIKLRPNRYHQMTVQLMNTGHHGFWIGESCRIEFMASPIVLAPVKPIEYDIVNGDMPFAEFFQGSQQFFLCFVSLTALPVTHGPFWHNLRFAGKFAVSS